MYLAQINRYELKELKDCNNFAGLWQDNKKRKTLFKTEGDCWFEIIGMEGWLWHSRIEIEVFSDKKTLKQKLTDYNKAYLFLKHNFAVQELNMNICDDICKITFLN